MVGKLSMRSSCPVARLLAVSFASFVVALVTLAAAPLRAGDVYWSVAAGDWSVPSNWGGSLPTSSDDAYIASGRTATITLPGEVCGNLRLGSTAGSGSIEMTGGELSVPVGGSEFIGFNSTFTQSGGTNTISDALDGFKYHSLELGHSGGSGTYNLSGTGVVSTGGLVVGDNYTGTFTQTGGTISMTFGTYIGYNGNGTYNLSGSGQLLAGDPTGGGSERAANFECIGFQSNGTFNQTGGTHVIDGYLTMGAYHSGSGTYNLDDGAFSTATGLYVGVDGSAIFNQSGGNNLASGGLTLGVERYSHGTYNLDGGLLTISSLTKGSGTATFNFGGGTLQASSSFSTSLPMTLTGIGGNANIDTAGYEVMLSGDLSGEGGLNKLGLGTLTLGGVNTYTDNTTVSDGLLALASSGSLLLDISSSGDSTSILGEGAIDLDGTLVFDITDVLGPGNWDVLDVGTLMETFGDTFDVEFAMGLNSFAATESSPGVWTCDIAPLGIVLFTESTGMLTIVPEPGTLSLFAMGLLGLLAHGWRQTRRT